MTEIDPPSPPIPLDYAPDPGRQRWTRRIVRTVITLTLLLAVVWLAHSNRDEISLRARRWYWARQCLAHVTPPGTELLVFDNPAALVNANPDYMIDADPTAYAPSGLYRNAHRLSQLRLPAPPAGYMPQVWKEFAKLDPRSARFSASPMYTPVPMNFLGERRTPAGKRRLVVIAGAMVNALAMEHQIASLVLPLPGLLSSPPTPKGPFKAYQWSGQFRPAYLKPAIADPNDPTHLTIEFTISAYGYGNSERKGVIDVYVRDDDTLEFKIRDPATTQGL